MFTLGGEPDGERGDVLDDGRIVIEVTERGKKWRAAYDPEADIINLPKEAGLLPTQTQREQARQALAESIRPPRPQRQPMAIATPYREEDFDQ